MMRAACVGLGVMGYPMAGQAQWVLTCAGKDAGFSMHQCPAVRLALKTHN